ncbi:hypothetical protein JOC73_001652 [Alkaliphilus hydrothermalis]|uniref:LPXTG cell wall anchor domain-containing protein n=1 Tax=Alkaliphilus hydrothermalis TaxID=1482730 RepID=A0ABS2NQ63_9FIRM|nr:hypothetical protein [Alkaliphilus hydrothermalis]
MDLWLQALFTFLFVVVGFIILYILYKKKKI